MAFFSFFKTPKHQRFNYIPRYYDPQKERLDEILGKHKGEGLSETELAKSRISSSFRRKSYRSSANKDAIRRSNILLLAIIVVLFGLTYVLLTVYLPEFMSLFEG